MKRQAGILAILCLLSTTVGAKSSCEGGLKGCHYSTTGAMNLHTASKEHAKIIPLRINENTFGDISLYHSKANHMDSVRGAFSFHNDTGHKAIIRYRVILKDKKGIVAQTKGHLHLLPGNTQQIKISNIVLSERDIKNITNYEIQMTGTH